MSIDYRKEELLTLTEASQALPRVGGKRPHPSSLWRWHRTGIQGIHLECIRMGRRLLTSREALVRFTQQLAQRDDRHCPTRPRSSNDEPRTDKQRARAIEDAERELADAGFKS